VKQGDAVEKDKPLRLHHKTSMSWAFSNGKDFFSTRFKKGM